MSRLAILGAMLATLTLTDVGLGLHILHADGDPLSQTDFRVVVVLSVPVYLAACWLVQQPGRMPSLWLILGIAFALRIALLIAPPMLSSDIYRYVWDGMVQNAGINPYLHIPADAALANLRDTAIYTNINRADYAPTIYPPFAEMLFAAIAAISPTLLAMKAAMLAMEAVTIFCLLRLLNLAGKPAAQVLIYAWNPLAIWEFAGNAHVDAAAAAMLVLALLLRATARPGLAGLTLGAAILTKFLPAIAAPALWQRGTAGWRIIAGALFCVTALYAFYIIWGDAGSHVLGFLGGYSGEEGLNTGSGIWALAGVGLLTDLPTWAAPLYLSLTAIGLAALGCWIAFRARPNQGTQADTIRLCRDAALLATTLMLAISPHYPWYFVWLAALTTVTPSPTAIWLSAGSILLYANPLPDHFIWQSLVFAPALLLAFREYRARPLAPPIQALQGSF